MNGLCSKLVPWTLCLRRIMFKSGRVLRAFACLGDVQGRPGPQKSESILVVEEIEAWGIDLNRSNCGEVLRVLKTRWNREEIDTCLQLFAMLSLFWSTLQMYLDTYFILFHQKQPSSAVVVNLCFCLFSMNYLGSVNPVAQKTSPSLSSLSLDIPLLVLPQKVYWFN